MSPTRRDQLKRLRITFFLFGLALIVTGAVYYAITKVQKDTDRRVNAIVCVTRPYITQSRARSDFLSRTEKDPTRRAAAEQAVKSADQFLAGLLLHPRDYDCRPLLKRLLAEAQARRIRIEKEARSGNP